MGITKGGFVSMRDPTGGQMTYFFQVFELISFIGCGYYFGIGKFFESIFLFVIGFQIAIFVGELMKHDTIQKEVKEDGIC